MSLSKTCNTIISLHSTVSLMRLQNEVILFDLIILVDIGLLSPQLLRVVFYFPSFVKYSTDRHMWLTGQVSFATQDESCWSVSDKECPIVQCCLCHRQHLFIAQPCAVCQRRPHSFPRTGVDTSSQQKLAVWGHHLLCRGIFLHSGRTRIKGIFITLLSDLTYHFFRHATVLSIDTAAVFEVTGDAELKSIFQTPPSLFFSRLSLPPTSICLFM